MEVPVNYLAILGGAVISMILGFLWYGPLFGKAWMASLKISQKEIDDANKKGMAKEFAINFVAALILSYVLAHSFEFASTYMKVSGAAAGVSVGFWNWLGIVAPVTISGVLWEGKSWKWWLITNGYYLAQLTSVGILIAVWR